ncbi:MAG: Clp protease N-terminal domain-containing protein, partial [Gammaproteobacteria bacterium]
MLSKELEFCLNTAFKEARAKRHEFMTVEHLLLALLDTPRVAEVLRACGADVQSMQHELTRYIDEN